VAFSLLALPVQRQCNLGLREENVILKSNVVRRGKILSRILSSYCQWGSPPQTSPAVSAFPNGEWIALGCARAEMLIITLGSRNAKAQS
jgi:hypothetical protein